MGWLKRRRRLQGNGTGGIRRSPQVVGKESLPCPGHRLTRMVTPAPTNGMYIRDERHANPLHA